MNTLDVVGRLATTCYARLLAIIAARTHDLSAAEDALGDAFHAALKQWPIEGVPQAPEAWLVTTAKRRLMDHWRHLKVHVEQENKLRIEYELASLQEIVIEADGRAFPDERLKLLFACSHPAIEVAMRAPLMLQVVLGLDAQRIASAFLVSPRAMSQRLVRVKNKIRVSRIPFRIPDFTELKGRMVSVMETVYAAYSAGWGTSLDPTEMNRGLNREALFLAETLVEVLPDEPEVLGLLALLLYCEARQQARQDENGNFVPLDRQDLSRWDHALIEKAEEALRRAAKSSCPGRFQLEAAIQSAHVDRLRANRPNWPDILSLYRNLLEVSPSLGSQVAYAAALHQAGHSQAARDFLELLPMERINSYQAYWATLAHVAFALGLKSVAKDAFQRAAGLTQDELTRRFLLNHMADCADP